MSRHHDGTHTHGPAGGALSGLDSAAEGLGKAIMVVVLAVAAINVAAWLLHVLVIVAMCIGFLVIGATTGYVGVRLWARRRRMLAPPAVYPPAYLAARPEAPGYLPPVPGSAALPEGGQHVHIHLAPGTSTAEVARLLRGDQR